MWADVEKPGLGAHVEVFFHDATEVDRHLPPGEVDDAGTKLLVERI